MVPPGLMTLLLLSCMDLVARVHADGGDEAEARQAFEQYVQDFGKTYSGSEREARFITFQKNLRFVTEHNAAGHKFQLALNDMSDWELEEFGKKMGLNASAEMPEDAWAEMPLLGTMSAKMKKSELPASVDWRNSGCLTPVLDQGHCGGCWSFSATSAISAAWQLATGTLLELSEQQMMDCSSDYGNKGCEGGNMALAFLYAKTVPLCTAASYPYQAGVGACRQDSCAVALPAGAVMGYRRVQPGDEQALMEAVAQQPVSIGIEAERSQAFQMYKSGVMSGVCGTKPNHGVLLVGYGKEDGQDYWLVQNSWGPRWGDNGYFKLARGPGSTGTGECGILSMPFYPVVDPSVTPAPMPAPSPGSSTISPPTPSPTPSARYGKPPCTPSDEALYKIGSNAAICAPRCGSDGTCPNGGQCNLQDNSWMGWLLDKRYCSLPCRSTTSCPSGLTCVQRNAIYGGGVCMWEIAPSVSATEKAVVQNALDQAERAIDAAVPKDKQLSDDAQGKSGPNRRLRQEPSSPQLFA